jgi:predicted outer membrane protein
MVDYMANPVETIAAVAAVASALAAACAAYATYRQGQLQGQGLKQDLFDRRFKVYLAVRGFLSGFTASNEDPDDLQSKAIALLRDTKEAEWLFGPEVQEFIERKLYSAAIAFSTLQRLSLQVQKQSRMLNEQQRNEFDQRLAWLMVDAHKETHTVFKEYLRLHEADQ